MNNNIMTESNQEKLHRLMNINIDIDHSMSPIIDEIITMISKSISLSKLDQERLDYLNEYLNYLYNRRLMICKLIDDLN